MNFALRLDQKNRESRDSAASPSPETESVPASRRNNDIWVTRCRTHYNFACIVSGEAPYLQVPALRSDYDPATITNAFA